MLYMDAMASFWREWIVNYDLSHQFRLTQDANRGSRAIVGRAQSWGRSHYEKILAWARRTEDRIGNSALKWALRTLGAVSLVVFLVSIPRLLGWFRRSRLARRPQSAPRVAASIWYERMLRQAARRGWAKAVTQTPEEFADSISDSKLKERVSGFSERYEHARFGNSADDAARLPELYEDIKSSR
jgi:hypothetical protein